MSNDYFSKDLPIINMRNLFRTTYGRDVRLSDEKILSIYNLVGDGYSSAEERDAYRLDEMVLAENETKP